jgi:adenylate cyclase
VLLAALSLFLVYSPFSDPLRNVVFDGYQRLIPQERLSQPVAIVVIDENALQRYGQWPWPRTRMAQLVGRIAEYKPAAIGLDLLFPEPDRFSPGNIAEEMPIMPSALAAALRMMPSNDKLFADAIRGKDVVMAIGVNNYVDPRFPDPPRAPSVRVTGERYKQIRADKGHIASLDLIDAAAAGRGVITSGQQEQVVRRAPLLMRVQGVLVPSLGVETMHVGIGGNIEVGDAPGGLLHLRFGEVSTTLQPDGTTWIRYSPYDEQRLVSAFDVMEGKANAEVIRGKIVLVGVSGLGVQDFKTTPLGEFVPGVAVHAQLIENLYNGVSLTRPEMAVRIEAAVFLACGLLLVVFVPRMSALQGINAAFGLVVLMLGCAIVAFYHLHMLFDFAWPAIGTVAVFGAALVGTLSEAERQRRQLRDQAARMAGEVDGGRRHPIGQLPHPH